MILCCLFSMRNAGSTPTLHLWIISKIGFNNSCIFGFILQLVINLFLTNITDWV